LWITTKKKLRSYTGEIRKREKKHRLFLRETPYPRRVEPGSCLPGAPNDKIRFIIEDSVTAMNQGLTLFHFKEGDTFGEMELLDVRPSVATIKAMAPAKVMSISNRSLRQIYKNDIKAFDLIIMNLARDISRRLRNMHEKSAQESPHMEWN
jgi:CRP-like cAMP-binding protein